MGVISLEREMGDNNEIVTSFELPFNLAFYEVIKLEKVAGDVDFETSFEMPFNRAFYEIIKLEKVAGDVDFEPSFDMPFNLAFYEVIKLEKVVGDTVFEPTYEMPMTRAVFEKLQNATNGETIVFVNRPQAVFARFVRTKNRFAEWQAPTMSRKIVIVPKKQSISLAVPVLKVVNEPYYEKKTLILENPVIDPNAKYLEKSCFCSPKV